MRLYWEKKRDGVERYQITSAMWSELRFGKRPLEL